MPACCPLLLALGLMLAAMPAPAAGAVWRCAGERGPVFTDRPCADGRLLPALPVTVIAAPPAPATAFGRSSRPAPKRGQAKRDGEPPVSFDTERIRHAMIRDRAVPGMSPAQLRFTLGEPDEIRIERGAGRGREVWRWRDARRRLRVTLRQGRVVAVEEILIRSRK